MRQWALPICRRPLSARTGIGRGKEVRLRFEGYRRSVGSQPNQQIPDPCLPRPCSGRRCCQSVRPQSSRTNPPTYLGLVESNDTVDLRDLHPAQQIPDTYLPRPCSGRRCRRSVSVRSQPSPTNPRALPTSALLRASMLLVCETSTQSNKPQALAYLGLVEGNNAVGLSVSPKPIQPTPDPCLPC